VGGNGGKLAGTTTLGSGLVGGKKVMEDSVELQPL
jgi:hypothetical protein